MGLGIAPLTSVAYYVSTSLIERGRCGATRARATSYNPGSSRQRDTGDFSQRLDYFEDARAGIESRASSVSLPSNQVAGRGGIRNWDSYVMTRRPQVKRWTKSGGRIRSLRPDFKLQMESGFVRGNRFAKGLTITPQRGRRRISGEPFQWSGSPLLALRFPSIAATAVAGDGVLEFGGLAFEGFLHDAPAFRLVAHRARTSCAWPAQT